MHHNFSGSLHFLDAIERKVIKVAGRVEVPLLVPHDLFEKVVAAGLTLAFLEQEVVCRSNLVVFVVLNVRHSLVQVAVGRNPTGREAVLDLREELVDHGDSVLADHDAIHFIGLDLVVPLVISYVREGHPCCRICVQNFLDQILAGFANEPWDQEIAVKNLLVEL